MSVDRLHIICGNCGHDATDGNFTWRYRPKERYGTAEFYSADVLISCANCGTLHSLGKYMQEESEVKMRNKICGGCRYFDEEVSHCERFECYTREHSIACNAFKPIEESEVKNE